MPQCDAGLMMVLRALSLEALAAEFAAEEITFEELGRWDVPSFLCLRVARKMTAARARAFQGYCVGPDARAQLLANG